MPAVVADPDMIERVLTNLLDNALRHTPAGGWMAVELTQEDGRFGVRVSDNGGGIHAEIRADLFERPSPLRGGDGRLEEEAETGAAFSFALPVG